MNSYTKLLFRRLINPNMKKYDKVMKELKMKFQVEKNHNKMLTELKNLKWVNVHDNKNFILF